MAVIELAKLAGVAPNVIRYYTRIGLLKPARSTGNNYRQYGPDSVRRVWFIRLSQRLGFSLGEIAEIIETSRQGNNPCPMVRETIQRRMNENSRALADLVALQNRMERALAQWRTLSDGMPDGHAICSLIEAVAETDA